ncbi:MAG: DUF4338 domain-containing protein [Paracoccaceae bacterium]|nr:DUF4338 domain-containing protein [Paracoccaceae bacterium]
MDPAPTTVDEVRPLKMRPVVRKTRGQAFERVRRPLPLSRIQDPGRHLDALRRPPTKTVGRSPMLGFSTAAWKLARDEFIGWSPEVRERNLCRVIDNSCFPIMPWTRIPNLASHILSTVRSQLLQDCYMQYRVIPVLMETFVETLRFSGAVCRA